jgi:hypothetical protein
MVMGSAAYMIFAFLTIDKGSLLSGSSKIMVGCSN